MHHHAARWFVLTNNQPRCSRSFRCRPTHSAPNRLFSTLLTPPIIEGSHSFATLVRGPFPVSQTNHSSARVIPVRPRRVSCANHRFPAYFSRFPLFFAPHLAVRHPTRRHCGSTRTPAPPKETGCRATRPGTPGRRRRSSPQQSQHHAPEPGCCSGCLAMNSSRFSSAN